MSNALAAKSAAPSFRGFLTSGYQNFLVANEPEGTMGALRLLFCLFCILIAPLIIILPAFLTMIESFIDLLWNKEE